MQDSSSLLKNVQIVHRNLIVSLPLIYNILKFVHLRKRWLPDWMVAVLIC